MIATTESRASVASHAEAARRQLFLRLMTDYRAALDRLAAAYLSDRRDREDLLQEIAMALWQAIPRFRGESSERTWLYRIAHNTAITASAKLRRRDRIETGFDDLPAPPPAPAAGPDDRLIQRQQRERLTTAIRDLPPADRQILTLHLEQLSCREIQEVTGISEGAIATRLSRIRDRLAAILHPQEETDHDPR